MMCFFAKNNVEYLRLEDVGYLLLNFTPTVSQPGILSAYLYANDFADRTYCDTVFVGADVAGDARIEYMHYDRWAEALLYSAIIDNTGRSIFGNLLDTTVSDERLKSGIEDFKEECSECVKNVKIKTFNYKEGNTKTTTNTWWWHKKYIQNHVPVALLMHVWGE